MDQEYTVKAVSKKVNDWESKYGPMKSYLIQVEGNGEPVKLNQKADTPAPQVGDKLNGHIEQDQWDNQVFKKAKKVFGGGYQRDNSAIQAQWAIGQAVQIAEKRWPEEGYFSQVEEIAKNLFSMIDRVKNSGLQSGGQVVLTPTVPDATNEQKSQAAAEPEEDKEFQNLLAKQFDGEGEPINLEDIPF